MLVIFSKAEFFFRLGRKWVKSGILVDAEAFTKEQLAILQNEINLLVREATEDEIKELPKAQPDDVSPNADVDPVSDADVLNALIAAIPQLEDGDFTKNGDPKLPNLRKAVDLDPELVTQDKVAHALDALKNSGFKPPKA